MIDALSRRSLADFPFIVCPCFESIMNRARLAGKTAKKRSYPARKGEAFSAFAVAPFAFRTAAGRVFSLGECRVPGGLPRRPLDLFLSPQPLGKAS